VEIEDKSAVDPRGRGGGRANERTSGSPLASPLASAPPLALPLASPWASAPRSRIREWAMRRIWERGTAEDEGGSASRI
jgi:hypothetical protein